MSDSSVPLGVRHSPAGEIPYVDLAGQHAPIKADLIEAISRVIDAGQFILGEQVGEFERQFASACGVRHAVGVNSGTDALIFALRAVGVGPGDEVITPPNSFVASTGSITLVGARPVFVDVRDDYNIDPRGIELAITPRTKAVMVVHLTGRPCEMDSITQLAQGRGIALVEDCAQAVGATYKGRQVGSFGQAGCFSLHPLKTLNACGDAGVLTTNDPDLYEQFGLMRNLGLRTREDCVMWSSNSRLDTLQAAILLVKMRYLQAWTQRRQQNAQYYRTRLARISEVEVPTERQGEASVYHTFVVQVERRDELKRFLEEHGIGTSIHYPIPIHLTTIGRELGYGKGSFPVAERQARRILSLPIYPELSETAIDRICETIGAFYYGE